MAQSSKVWNISNILCSKLRTVLYFVWVKQCCRILFWLRDDCTMIFCFTVSSWSAMMIKRQWKLVEVMIADQFITFALWRTWLSWLSSCSYASLFYILMDILYMNKSFLFRHVQYLEVLCHWNFYWRFQFPIRRSWSKFLADGHFFQTKLKFWIFIADIKVDLLTD